MISHDLSTNIFFTLKTEQNKTKINLIFQSSFPSPVNSFPALEINVGQGAWKGLYLFKKGSCKKTNKTKSASKDFRKADFGPQKCLWKRQNQERDWI